MRYHHSSPPLISVTATKGPHRPLTRATSHSVDANHARRHIDNARVVLTFGIDNVSKCSLLMRKDRTRTNVVRQRLGALKQRP